MISKVIDHALDDCLEDRKLCMTFVYVYRTFRDNENEPSWGTEAAINSGQVVLHTDLVGSSVTPHGVSNSAGVALRPKDILCK